MATNYLQNGLVLDHTAGADIASGAVVVIGVRVGVALDAIANGAVGPLQVEGVFSLAKKSTDVIAQGAIVYWDDTNKEVTTTSTSNTLMGYAIAAAGSGITTAKVKLNA
jgi:predicted RecA/RadA family phage recombinase